MASPNFDSFDPTPEGTISSHNIDDDSDEDMRESQEPNSAPNENQGTVITAPDRRLLSTSKSDAEPERNVRRRLDL